MAFLIYVGATVCIAVLLAILFVCVLVAIWWFPAKGCFALGPKLRGRLVTDNRLNGQNLNLLVGLQSRRKARWFFGLMLLDTTDQPPRWPWIISPKPQDGVSHDR